MRNCEYYVGTPDGVFGSRTLKRIPQSDRWNSEYICNVKGTTWAQPGGDRSSRVSMDPEFIKDVPQRVASDPEGSLPGIRRVRLNPRDFKVHGFTPGCPSCTAIKNGSVSQNHSEACRSRTENCLRGTPQGSKRIKDSEDRTTRIIARQIEELMINVNVGKFILTIMLMSSFRPLLPHRWAVHPPLGISGAVTKKKMRVLINSVGLSRMRPKMTL